MITTEQARSIKLLCQQHSDHRLAKYRDWRMACRLAEHYARLLGLHVGRRQLDSIRCPRLKILDMGGGLSYFAAECQAMGHDATTIDLPDELPEAAAKVFGIKYIPHMIVAELPLPGTETYDLITAFRLNLTEPDRWQWDEYRVFADEILGRLNPGGRWFMGPNRGENVAFVLDVEKWKEILGSRATVCNPSRSTVLITKQ